MGILDLYFGPAGPPLEIESGGTLHNVATTKEGVSPEAGVMFLAAATTVTGFAGGKAGRRILVYAHGGPVTLKHQNAGSLAANRVAASSASDVTVDAGAIQALVWNHKAERWVPVGGLDGGSVATANGDAPQAAVQIDTTDATPTNIGDAIELATDTVTTVDIAAQAIQVGASKAKIFSVRRSFLNDGGAVTDGTQQDLITAEELGGALAASIAITRTGTTAQPQATGVAATGIRWYLISQAMKVASLTGSVPAAPTGISPNTGTAAGGTVVQITVASSTGLTGAKVGGVALTAFSIVNATTVQGTTGAHAAGVVDVVVSNVFGDSAALVGGYTYSAAVFDPADLALTGWWRASYSASPWTGTASAGSSGTRNLTEATNPPSAGAALNGHTPADFDGTNDMLGAGAISGLYSASAYSGAALIYLDAVTTNNAVATSPFLNEPIINTAATGDIGVSFRNSAGTITADVWHWTGAAYAYASVTVTLATWLLLQWKLEAGSLYIRVNGGVWSTGAAANAASLTSSTRVGGSYDAAWFLNGKIAELMTANTALAGVDFDGVIEYVNDRYGLAL